jgi:hypothetical protein
MRVTLYSRVQNAIWLLCIFHTRFIVMGSVSWHQSISVIGLRVAMVLIYTVWLWGDISYALGYASSPMLLSNGLSLKEIDRGYTSVCSW